MYGPRWSGAGCSTVGSAAQGRVKGFVLISRRDWVRTVHGRDAWDETLTAVGTDARSVLRRPLSAMGWYSLAVNEELDRALCRRFGKGEPRFFRELGAHSADLIVASTYPTAFRERDPMAFVRAVSGQAPRYYDGLQVRIEERGTGDIVLYFEGVRSNETNCLSNVGYYVRGIELCGGQQAQGDEEGCTRDGNLACVYRFRWRPPVPEVAVGGKR